MLPAILNKSWRQHPTKKQLYGHLPSIMKAIKVRRTRHSAHCWRSRDELKSDVLQWTPSHGRAKAGRPARTYTQQLCADTGCNSEDLPEAMDDREVWRERIRDIRADVETSIATSLHSSQRNDSFLKNDITEKIWSFVTIFEAVSRGFTQINVRTQPQWPSFVEETLCCVYGGIILSF